MFSTSELRPPAARTREEARNREPLGPVASAWERVWPIAALGAAYWASGKLALLMAIPPGYATAVWPGSGLALVGVLLYGNRVALGVLAGSFLVNLGTSFDSSSSLAIVRSIATPLGIAIGASLQAIVGAAGIRRHVGFPSALDAGAEVGKFIALGGPIACVISASVATTLLYILGVVDGASLAFSWWTWWVGDSIGVVIFAPLAIALLGLPRSAWRHRRLVVIGPLVAGFTVTTLLFVRASAWEESRIRGDFERRAAAIARPLESKLEVYQNLMTSIASLLDASPDVGRDAFRAFVGRALDAYPGVQAFSWNPRVRAPDRARFEEAARRSGFSAFEFKEKSPSGTFVPAAPRPEYVVVYYIEPLERNEPALGYDIASEPARSAALLEAERTGRPTVTARITLVQERNTQSGVLLLVPIFERATSAEAVGRTLRGYAVGVFRIGDVVEKALEGVDVSGIELSLTDESAPPGERLLYRSSMSGDAGPSREAFDWSRSFEFGGRSWKLFAWASSDSMAGRRSWQAWMVLVAGLFFTGLLGSVLLIATGRTARVEAEVAARTRELVASNETLAASERALRASDQRSHALLCELEDLNENLELRVTERTRQLSEANAHLAATTADLALNLEKLRTAQEQLVQAGKLAALGQLLAGIAHEINNPLTVILGFAEGLNRRVEEGSSLKLAVSSIVREALRSKSLVQGLLMFSRNGRRERDRIDLEKLLRGTGQLLEARAQMQDTRLSLDLPGDAPRVFASATELQQVIVNLGNNALDAIGRGGQIVIRSRRSGAGEVHVEIEDTGPGIPHDVRARIFEPFFTTKDVGKGTGLGLSIAYEIVQRHGGSIDVESELGRGTLMRVRLPLGGSAGPQEARNG